MKRWFYIQTESQFGGIARLCEDQPKNARLIQLVSAGQYWYAIYEVEGDESKLNFASAIEAIANMGTLARELDSSKVKKSALSSIDDIRRLLYKIETELKRRG